MQWNLYENNLTLDPYYMIPKFVWTISFLCLEIAFVLINYIILKEKMKYK